MNSAPQTQGLSYIYWFAYYNLDSPSVRYRGDYPLRALKKKFGIGYCLVIPQYRVKNILVFIKAYLSALLMQKRNSLIVIQRINTNWIYANLLKLLVRLRNNTLYDTDDADYLEQPDRNIHYFMKHCRAVSVGSNELVNYVSRFNRNILLNTSPVVDLNMVKKSRNEILNIGWIGCFGGGHKKSLVKLLFPALKNLPFAVKLTILGVSSRQERAWLTGHFAKNHNVTLVMPQDINWHNENTIQEHIRMFDIGIATLLDDELHRSKSAFKLKQYMNNGVPVLSSDLPENNRFIKDGVNGFTCDSPAGFRKSIIQFCNMHDDEYAAFIEGARMGVARFDINNYSVNLLRHYEEMQEIFKAAPITGSLNFNNK